MAILDQNQYPAIRGQSLVIKSFESNDNVSWDDTLSVSRDDSDSDFKFEMKRIYRKDNVDGFEPKEVWCAEIDIGEEQAVLLAKHILSYFQGK